MAIPTQPNSAKTILDISSKVGARAILQVPSANTLNSVLSEEDLEIVGEAFQIVSAYKGDRLVSSPLIEIQQDLMKLQAIKLDMSWRFAKLISYSDSLADEMKLVRSSVANEARKVQHQMEAEGHTVRVTVEDIKDLSYSKTELLWKEREETKMVSDFLKWTYYAVRDSCDSLEKALHRLWRQEGDMSRL